MAQAVPVSSRWSAAGWFRSWPAFGDRLAVLKMAGGGTSAAGRRGRLNCWHIAGYSRLWAPNLAHFHLPSGAPQGMGGCFENRAPGEKRAPPGRRSKGGRLDKACSPPARRAGRRNTADAVFMLGRRPDDHERAFGKRASQSARTDP